MAAHRTREIKDRTTSAFEQGKEAVQRAAKELGRDAEEAANADDQHAFTEAGATTMRG